MKKDIFVTFYTKEDGKLELTYEEWNRLDPDSIAYHREDGPAREWADGTKEWFLNGKRHRIDGPAVEWDNGERIWYIDDEEYSKEDFNRIIREAKSLPLELRLTDPRWWVREMK
jgi:hypothetical protein